MKEVSKLSITQFLILGISKSLFLNAVIQTVFYVMNTILRKRKDFAINALKVLKLKKGQNA